MVADGFNCLIDRLFAFIVARFTPQMFSAMRFGVYLFFASFMILSIVFVWFFLPETRLVPLERMNELFSRDLPPWKAHEVVMSQARKANLVQGNYDSRDATKESRSASLISDPDKRSR